MSICTVLRICYSDTLKLHLISVLKLERETPLKKIEENRDVTPSKQAEREREVKFFIYRRRRAIKLVTTLPLFLYVLCV